MKRLSSFTRVRTLTRWLERLQARATAAGGHTRSAQGDTWLELGQDHTFSGQVRRITSGLRITPFFWQLNADVYASTQAPTTIEGASLLASPTLPMPSGDAIVSLVLDGHIQAVTADAIANVITFDRIVSSVTVQVTGTLPVSLEAQIHAERGTTGSPPVPFFSITSTQPQVRVVLPIATLSNQRITHSLLTGSPLVHGRGLVLLDFPVNTFVTDI